MFETIECGAVVNVTPRIRNGGRVTAEIALKITDLIPGDKTSELPVPSTRSINSRATLDSNTTLVLRLTPETGESSEDGDVLYLLMQTKVLPAQSHAKSAAPVEMDLIDALAEISSRTKVSIETDATVKSEQVMVKPTENSVEKALRDVLEDTGYTFHRIGDGYLVYRPITATFMGEDLREALEAVAVQAGVSIVCDPNVTGEVYAELQDVPVETALDIMLAGSPYILETKLDGYLVTDRETSTIPRQKSSKNAVRIEARFLQVSDELLAGLLEDPNTPEELAAALTPREEEWIREAVSLNDAQVEFLLRAVQRSKQSCSLATPQVTVLDGEATEMSFGRAVPQFVCFSEPNGPSDEPIAQYESIRAGVEFDFTPHLQKGSDNVYLEVKAKITSVLGNEERIHEGKYPYTLPIISTVEVQTAVMTPLTKTVLIGGTQIESLGQAEPSSETWAGRLLVLIRAKRKTLDKSETPPVGPPLGLPMGGMGGFAPGQPPLPPKERK